MSESQRILVVDDEPQITRVLRRGLRRAPLRRARRCRWRGPDWNYFMTGSRIWSLLIFPCPTWVVWNFASSCGAVFQRPNNRAVG